MQINITEVLGKCKTCAILRNRIPINCKGIILGPTTINFYFLALYLRGETYEELHGV